MRRAWFRPLLLGAALLGAMSCRPVDDAVAPGEIPPTPSLTPAASALRRLSYAQYASIVHDVLGEDIVVPPRNVLEPDVDDSGYLAIDSSSVTISRRGVAQYETAAYQIAHAALDATHRTTLVPCAPAAADDATCTRTVLSALGLRLYRRPMTTDELDAAVTVSTGAGAALGDFYQGLEFGIALLLQSPSFLFREELGTDDPTHPGQRTYVGYEMASRLSFFLWNTAPDAALLDDAANGRLDTAEGVRAVAERMLADPRAEGGVRELATEWLGLAALDDLEKDSTVFTEISPDVGPSAREETLRVVTHVFESDMDARDLMTTRDTFVNRKLASLYRVRAPREDWGLVTFPATSPRAGILGHVSILAQYAHPIATSPTLRGKFVRERLLCERVPAPPVGVNTAIPAPSADAPTLRDRLLAHQQVEYCGACHRPLDDVGLGLEAFDALGRYRDVENGVPVDASGELDGVRFQDARALGEILHDDPRFAQCMVRQVYRVGSGHFETDGEDGTIRTLYVDFANHQYSLRHLMLEMVVSDGFRMAVAQP
jgi:hypothetical protein